MRIVTLNTWKNEGDYPRRLELMAAQLRELRADVICLQECFASGDADTAAHLARELAMRATQQPARHKPRSHQGQSVPSTSGLAVLSRVPPVGMGSLELTSDPRDGERVALRLDLQGGGSQGGGGLRILNLHLTHLRDETAAQLRSVQLAEALAWARAGWAGPLVVCGDLNMGRGDPAFAPLEAAAGDELGPTVHAGFFGDARPPGRAIDHCILLQPGGMRVGRRFLALQQADAAGRVPSDHAAIAIDLEKTAEGCGIPPRGAGLNI